MKPDVFERRSKILVVDDEPDSADLLRLRLERSSINCEVEVAYGGAEALQKVHQFMPDLILLDIMMPNIDGFEVCRSLKSDEHTRSIQIVVVTVLSELSKEIQALDLGADDFLTKTYDSTFRDRLLTRVRSALRAKFLHDDLEKSRQELAQKNEELQLLNSELEQANRFKSEFLRSLSHEIRTPLTSIMALSDAMLSGMVGELDERSKKSMGIILNGANHLLQLANNILDLSRIESGKLDVTEETFSLTDAVQYAFDSVTPMAHEKGLDLRQHHTEDIHITSDRSKITQILINLLSNAIKFTDEGYVELRGRRQQEKLELSVIDTGTGIKAEDIPSLFGEFTQLSNSDEKRAKGSGLGLNISKRLAKLLGGDITVESEFGKGSKFTFVLPL